MTIDPGQPDFDDEPAVYAFQRIVDSAADYPPGEELSSATVLQIADLDAEQRGDVIFGMACTLSQLFAGKFPPRAGEDDARITDRAARGIVKAAQNYRSLASFDETFRMWTDCLTKHQICKVTAALAVQLAVFYQADPMSDRGNELVGLLEKWLRAGQDDEPESK